VGELHHLQPLEQRAVAILSRFHNVVPPYRWSS
jgi:hypothetical protein